MNLNIKQILSTNFNLTLEEILNILYNMFVIIKATVTYKEKNIVLLNAFF
jgi:hypothetical protein